MNEVGLREVAKAQPFIYLSPSAVSYIMSKAFTFPAAHPNHHTTIVQESICSEYRSKIRNAIDHRQAHYPILTPRNKQTAMFKALAMMAIDDTLKCITTHKDATQEVKSQQVPPEGESAASQEVIRPPARRTRHRTLVIRHGREDGELGIQVLAEIHDTRDITAAVAVIRRRPDGNDGFISKVPLPDR